MYLMNKCYQTEHNSNGS